MISLFPMPDTMVGYLNAAARIAGSMALLLVAGVAPSSAQTNTVAPSSAGIESQEKATHRNDTERSLSSASSTLTLPKFGEISSDRLIAQDDLFAVFSDKYPVSPGHTLIVAKRSVALFRDLNTAEKERLLTWIQWTQQYLLKTLRPNPDAFNFGLNDGTAAGQTIAQFHFHIIPRYVSVTPSTFY